MTSSNTKIGGVIVLYSPDWDITRMALKALAPQLDELCIVDNTPGVDNSSNLPPIQNIKYIPLKENRGIAAAQNVGVKYLLDNGSDFILFSDQDSEARDNTVEKLFEGYQQLHNAGVKIAAVGTKAINKQTGNPYPPKSKEIGRVRELKDQPNYDDIMEVYSVRSSISLISKDSFEQVGGFDEALFIDGVDHEWCWRAWHARGLRSFIIEDAKIDHMLGEGDKKLAGREISIASPYRVYFQFRNFLWLKSRSYVPKFWKSKNAKKYFVKAFYFPIFAKPRMLYLRNIIRGLKDGLSNNTSHTSWPDFQQKND